jgi:hypothetical protein
MTYTDDDLKRLREVAADMRSGDLVRVLRHAVAGEPHWRFEARVLLEMIDAGIVEEKVHA